jgi:hypothetical protein
LEKAGNSKLHDSNVRKEGGTAIRYGWVAQNKTGKVEGNPDLEPQPEVHKWLKQSVFVNMFPFMNSSRKLIDMRT